MIESPHFGSLQFVRHAEFGRLEFCVPLSHCSVIVSTMLLPHTSRDLQSDEQPSPETVFESSQISPRLASTTPLPQTSADLQSPAQPSPEAVLPSSQTSPASTSTTLLPQVSFDVQSPEQPSFGRLLPSSHTSPAMTSFTPSPQRGSWQFGRHAASGSVEFAAPASHCS